jgi:hypothetical protein
VALGTGLASTEGQALENPVSPARAWPGGADALVAGGPAGPAPWSCPMRQRICRSSWRSSTDSCWRLRTTKMGRVRGKARAPARPPESPGPGNQATGHDSGRGQWADQAGSGNGLPLKEWAQSAREGRQAQARTIAPLIRCSHNPDHLTGLNRAAISSKGIRIRRQKRIKPETLIGNSAFPKHEVADFIDSDPSWGQARRILSFACFRRVLYGSA